MPAAYQNLYIEQGTTFSTTITVDDSYGANYNLTGYSVNSQIRKSYYSSNTTAVFSTSIDTNQSIITLSLSAATTSNIAAGRYVYDTTIKDQNNNVTRVLEGVIDVSPSVSR
jgi:hypothetical protein